MKKLFKYILIIIIAIVIAMIFLPFIFKDKLISKVKDVVNEQVDAKVDFGDASLSFFKAFPNISASLNDIKVEGIGQFENIPLFKAKRIDVGVNLSSVFGNDIQINKIHLEEPIINVVVDKNGKANYDITKTDSNQASDNSAYTANLSAYSINDGELRYKDLSSDIDVHLSDLDHSGKGDFSSTVFDLKTESEIKKANIVMAGIPYLTNAAIDADVDLNVDLTKNLYKLSKNNIAINNLDLEAVGQVGLLNDGYDIDMTINAPDNSFEDLFSLIPYAYSKEYQNIVAKGASSINAKLKGKYSDKGQYPAIDLNVVAKDGFVKYPDFSEEIKDINFNLDVAAQKSDWSDLKIDVPSYKMKFGEENLEGKLNIENALGNFLIDAIMKGNLDLAVIKRLFPVEGVNQLSGKALVDMVIKADKTSILNSDYNNIMFSGNSSFENINIQYDKYPKLTIPSGNVQASPAKAELTTRNASFGNSDFNVESSVQNPLSLLTTDAKTKVNLKLDSKVFDYNEIVGDQETSTEAGETQMDSLSESIITNTEIDYDVSIGTLKYEDYDITKVKSSGILEANHISFDDAELYLNDSKVEIDGDINNSYDYLFKDGTVDGKLELKSNTIDLNKMYGVEESSSEEAMETVIIPEKINLEIITNVSKIIYANYILENVKGKMDVNNGVANFNDVTMGILGGSLGLNGKYDSRNADEPQFELAYDLKNVAFRKLYENSNSFKALAPFAKFMTGNLNTDMKMSGPLDKEMMPKLSNISADGFLETLSSSLKGFEPLQAVGDKLGIASLKNVEIANTKNWFTVENGFVVLKDQGREIDGMKFLLGGKHSIDQTIDYLVKAEIPREKLKSNVASNVVEGGLSFIEKEAGKRGVDVDLGDMIFLDIQLTGSITNPKIKIIPTGSGGKSVKNIIKDELTNQADKLKDTISKEVKKKVDQVKSQVEDKVNEETEKAKTKVRDRVNKEVDKTKEKVEEVVKDKVKEEVKKQVEEKAGEVVKDKVDDVLEGKGKEVEEKAKDVLKDIFKKKKK